MVVMGIETSCDETSVAILAGRKVLSVITYSQACLHGPLGGVVPELASRDHVRRIATLAGEARRQAGVRLQDIEGIAVANRPGLIGALLVGLSFAKGLAYFRSIPLVGVNHLEAHLYSVFLEKEVPFPFVGLTVSGGHTCISLVKDFLSEIPLGRTLDDAAGESFDKVARLLGLGYPGGPELEALAEKGNPRAIDFPRPLLRSGRLNAPYDFSFSGLKSSVVNYVKRNSGENPADVAASFQEAVLEVLTEKLRAAAVAYGVKNIVVAGGVASNKALRKRIFDVFSENNYRVFIPSPRYCTDNAAMIAFLGARLLEGGKRDNLSLGARSRL